MVLSCSQIFATQSPLCDMFNCYIGLQVLYAVLRLIGDGEAGYVGQYSSGACWHQHATICNLFIYTVLTFSVFLL